MITIRTDSVHYDSFHLPSPGPHHNSSSHFVLFDHFSFKARRIEQTAVMGMLSLHDSCAGPDAALTFILCPPYTEERQTVSFYLFSFSVERLRPENVPGNQNFTQRGKEMLTLKHRKQKVQNQSWALIKNVVHLLSLLIYRSLNSCPHLTRIWVHMIVAEKV